MEVIDSRWRFLIEVLYFLVVLVTVLRAVADTRNSTKAMAYVLAILFLPIIGIIVYYSFGINHRKRKLYDKKVFSDRVLAERVKRHVSESARHVLDSGRIPKAYEATARYRSTSTPMPLTAGNRVKVLQNGEQKFPQLFEAIKAARDHVHVEYYIYEDDELGNQLADVLIRKAQEGVEVRFLFDDFGSHGLRRRLMKKLKEGGVEVAAFYRVRVYALANRLNYRNHRKIVVIDGRRAFVGGINVSDRYVNPVKGGGLYWRDTHLDILGPATAALQHVFLADWNFGVGDRVEVSERYFPIPDVSDPEEGQIVQVVPSGPDSKFPTILHSILSAIHSAQYQLWITTPYFIPTESMLDALVIAAKRGVHVRLLLPGKTDSLIVRAASRSYYSELLSAGVEVFEYQKGFVHAKTMVVDDALAIVGTANMDLRSFDLNFEVNAVLYDRHSIAELQKAFEADLEDARHIDVERWGSRKPYVRMYERVIRLVSPLM